MNDVAVNIEDVWIAIAELLDQSGVIDEVEYAVVEETLLDGTDIIMEVCDVEDV